MLACALLLASLDLALAQKGGAKGAMRNRGRGGGGAGRRGGSRAGDEDEDDASKWRRGRVTTYLCSTVERILERYDYSKPRPCVGLCYIK